MLLLLLQSAAGAVTTPTVTTDSYSILTSATAMVYGTLVSAGGGTVTARGFVISQSTNPTLSDTVYTVSGVGLGAFNQLLSSLSPLHTYYIRAYATNEAGTAYGDNISFVAPASASQEKYYVYNVYRAGAFVGTWSTEVMNDPTFRTTINGGVGELVIKLARPFDDFDEGNEVTLNNQVRVYCMDKDNPNGLLLYSGYISGYKPIVNGPNEYLEVTLLGYIAELQRMILRDTSGNTTLAYNSYEPAAILRDVIDKYRALGGTINYTATSVQNTNTTVSYTFNTNTIKECLDKILEMCPVGWYWRVDPDNTIYLAPKNVMADHSFNLGLEVERLETFRRIEDLVNRVLFTGGSSLFRKYENTSSQNTYGMYEKKIVDQRVTDATTAGIISNREINAKKDPEIRSTFEIVDNGGPQSRGYDIESVKVGQSVKVANLNVGTRTSTLWDIGVYDVDVYDQTIAASAADIVQILSIQYAPDSIIIEASSRLPQVAKRIEDINRNLENTQTVNNPTAPT